MDKNKKSNKDCEYHLEDFLTTGPVILEKKYTWKRFKDKYLQLIECLKKNKL